MGDAELAGSIELAQEASDLLARVRAGLLFEIAGPIAWQCGGRADAIVDIVGFVDARHLVGR
ncbi:MAG: hypothetical protein EOQ78_02325 [Mesorhizobium sp.]|nr:MAG: hypothetical protein EOQ78_02325 [Mesorhizobium sp.]